ncbi:hypothetical protein [Prescottella equi]|uniref:hypothetical protein n=1 Tax=Rhodococcus hoagii TaxID=43767 RepID=UPI003D9C3493
MKPRTSYGPEAIVLVLAAAGGVGLGFTLPVTAAIAVLLAVLVASYRQVIAAFPAGGGAYAVARRRFGDRAALTDHGLAQRLSPGDPRRESAGKVVDVVDDVPGAGHPLVDDGYVARAKSRRLLTQSQIIDSFVRGAWPQAPEKTVPVFRSVAATESFRAAGCRGGDPQTDPAACRRRRV